MILVFFLFRVDMISLLDRQLITGRDGYPGRWVSSDALMACLCLVSRHEKHRTRSYFSEAVWQSQARTTAGEFLC